MPDIVELKSVANPDDFLIAERLGDADGLPRANPYYAQRNRELKALWAQHEAQTIIGSALGKLGEPDPEPRPDPVAGALIEVVKQLAEINTTLANRDRTGRDDVVALYAVAFGAHGHVSEYSDAGQWLLAACKPPKKGGTPSVCDIRKLFSGPSGGAFRDNLADTRDAGRYGELVGHLSDPDLDRFLALTHAVCQSFKTDVSEPPPTEPRAS